MPRKFNYVDPADEWVGAAGPAMASAFAAVLLLPCFIKCALGINLSSLTPLARIFISVLSTQALFFIPPFYFMFKDKSGAGLAVKLGFRNWKLSYLRDVIVCEALIFIPLLIVAIAVAKILSLLGCSEKSAALELTRGAGRSSMAVFFAFSVIVSPIVEEFVFRRAVFTFVRRNFGRVPGIIIASAVFALMHGGLTQLLSLFALGAVLQIIYIRSDSLYPCVMLHSLHNFLILIIFTSLNLPGS